MSGDNSSGRYHATDPVEKGWQQTGSNEQSRVEFYQNTSTGAKIDYYPTTGTVKTHGFEHPTMGKTQMFRRDLTDTQFQSVLENPRAHTGKGYQTKK